MTIYKVVTEDMKSLGLRGNPTILTYPLGKWVTSPTVKLGKSDDGGIWVCRRYSDAKRLKKYMLAKHGANCRIFRAVYGRILFENSYRMKVEKIMLFKEML